MGFCKNWLFDLAVQADLIDSGEIMEEHFSSCNYI